MTHYATDKFWSCYRKLPKNAKDRADKAFALLRQNPGHPSLHFKKIGNCWSVRVDDAYRALAVKEENNFIWVWIGSHDEYENLINR